MRVLIAGGGMLGAATARHLAAHADVVLVGPAPPTATRSVVTRGGVTRSGVTRSGVTRSGAGEPAYGAHHDEGRIVRDLSRDPIWADLVHRARPGLADLDETLVVGCGAVSATSAGGPDYLAVAAAIAPGQRPDVRRLTIDEARDRFGGLRFRPGETIVHEPGAGRLNPRRYVELATSRAVTSGVELVDGAVVALAPAGGGGVEAELGDGRRLRADTAVVATGAFAAGSALLPVTLELRAKSEIYVMAEVDDDQAAALATMPCVVRAVDHPGLADLYVVPPVRYPAGRTYVKFGANTDVDRWLAGPADVRGWYRDGQSDGPLPAMRDVLTDLLPDVRFRSWHTRRCADAYTAHGRPYLDVLEPGRLVVALGGNGHAAQCADAIGSLTAELALEGDWEADLPRDAFRAVRAGRSRWRGLALLRDAGRPAPGGGRPLT